MLKPPKIIKETPVIKKKSFFGSHWNHALLIGDPRHDRHPTVPFLVDRKAFLAVYYNKQKGFQTNSFRQIIATIVLYTKAKRELVPLYVGDDLYWPKL